jgi:hypothetical protein
MVRIPRLPAALVAVAALVALVEADATGRSRAAPTNTLEPFIATKIAPVVGATLTGNPGNWQGTAPIKYAYQWLRCAEDGHECKSIGGATQQTYTIGKADVEHTLRFRVTAKNSDGKATADSNASSVVPGKEGAPTAASPPTISGQAVVGEHLTATTGSWDGNKPITFSFTWQTCNLSLSSCANQGGGSTYAVAKSDVGKLVRVRVKASNSVSSTNAFSAPTAPVKESGGAGGNAVPVANVGPAGERLVVDKVVFNPNPVTSRNVPIQVKVTVKDTKGRLVQGALVFVRSTPIVSSTPTDAPTGNDGMVTYSVQPRSDFPIKNGYSVQFFVKAYRSGDATLSGISGTRLVQVATHKP